MLTASGLYPLIHPFRSFVIKTKLSDVTYGIKLESGRSEYIAHIDNIKGYETRLDGLNEKMYVEELGEG